MTDLETRIARLSPEKRALLTLRLKKKGQAAVSPPAIPHRESSGSLPLSFAQQRLWFLDQLEPGNPVYNLPAAIRLAGKLDIQALKASLEEIFRRHAILRTTFIEREGVPLQEVSPDSPFSLLVEDLSCLPPLERETRAQEEMTSETRVGFDLAKGPLIRGASCVWARRSMSCC